MSQSPHKLLIVVLVLLIVIGPVSSVFASPPMCAPPQGQDTVTDDIVHADHGPITAMDDSRVDLPSNHDCDGCDKGCCQGDLCKMSHCAASAVALLSTATLEFDRYKSNDLTLNVEHPLSGQLTPPFRPPASLISSR